MHFLSPVEKETRSLFHKLHTVQADDFYIYQRLKDLLSVKHLGLAEDYFQGKVCLDAGCGSTAYATYKMLEMGAEKVCAFDLDESIFETVPKLLNKFEGRYNLTTGTVLDIQYADKFFDFTHCSGVLHHTTDLYKGLSELARVTKNGGIVYIELYGQGGLIREINNYLREKYSTDSQFRLLISSLTEQKIQDMVLWILDSMKENNDDLKDKIIEKKLIAQLFDNDLVLTIKDRIMSPIYREVSWEEIDGWLKENGFTNIKRLTKYPRYRNIRRFLAPMYYKYDNDFSKIFYGGGTVEVIATKI